MKKKKTIKKSHYIITTLIAIIIGLISFYYVDAEINKPTAEELELKKQQIEENNYLNAELNVAFDDCTDDRTNAEKWFYFIEILKKRNNTIFNYINYNNLIPIANYIIDNYYYFNDKEALKIIAKECKRVYNIQKNSFIDDTYAKLLYELKDVQTARKVETKLKEKKLAKTPKHITTWMNNELTKNTSKPLVDFNSVNFFNKGTAKVIGYIENYNGNQSLDFTTGIININNYFNNTSSQIKVTIYPDGKFKADVPLSHPIHSKIIINNKWIPIYLEPEQTLAIIVNGNELTPSKDKRNPYKKTMFLGALAQINHNLANYDYEVYNRKENDLKTANLSPIAYQKHRTEQLKFNLEKYNSYKKSRAIIDKTASIIKNTILIDNTLYLLDYLKYHFKDIELDTINKKYKTDVTDDFYLFLNNIPWNDQSLLTIDFFKRFVNKFEHFDRLNSENTIDKTNNNEVAFYTKQWQYKDDIVKNTFKIDITSFTYNLFKIRSLQNSVDHLKNKEQMLNCWNTIKTTNNSILLKKATQLINDN